MSSPIPVREADVQRAILDWLAKWRDSRSDLGRTLTKVTITADGCWAFAGSKDRRGYGQVISFISRHPKKTTTKRAHRIVYKEWFGAIPADTEIDHLCRNRACVNPLHLEAVSHLENVRRGNAGKHIAAKTHCKQGHPFDEKNTRWGKGRRHCNECGRRAAREYQRNKRAAIKGIGHTETNSGLACG